MMLIDTHCHLDAPEFDGERDTLVGAARQAGVTDIVVPAVTAANFISTRDMREQHGCLPAYGLHPIYLDSHRDGDLDRLDEWLARERPVAVGEIGLDFYLERLDPAQQEILFSEQLRLAKKHGLPVLLHVRRSADRVLKYLRRFGIERGIAHAFNGSEDQAHAFMRQGLKLGFGGAMSYTGSRRIRHLAATLPLDALVLETDAPDIPPCWATRSEPADVARHAAGLAGLRGICVEEAAAATRANACAALGLPLTPRAN